MPQQQRGSTLLISLVLMAVITLLGLSTMRTAITGEKIAGHIQDQHLATESAESALRRGQRFVRTFGRSIPSRILHDTIAKPGVPATSPIYDQPNLTSWTERVVEVTASEMQISTNDDAVTPLPRPQYKLELFDTDENEWGQGSSVSAEEQDIRENAYYRIFGRGVGRSGGNEVILQSLLIRKL